MSRLASGAAFAAVVPAFALPFGFVSSCDGEEVRFTGLELATFGVPPDDSSLLVIALLAVAGVSVLLE